MLSTRPPGPQPQTFTSMGGPVTTTMATGPNGQLIQILGVGPNVSMAGVRPGTTLTTVPSTIMSQPGGIVTTGVPTGGKGGPAGALAPRLVQLPHNLRFTQNLTTVRPGTTFNAPVCIIVTG